MVLMPGNQEFRFVPFLSTIRILNQFWKKPSKYFITIKYSSNSSDEVSSVRSRLIAKEYPNVGILGDSSASVRNGRNGSL
jgi:hypothetical protein